MLHKLLSLCLFFSLVSCVSTPENLQLSEAPASAVFAEGGGQAEVVVARPGITGWMIGFGVHVNGEKVGTIRSNDYVRALVDPGEVHVLVTAEADCEARFPVEADRTYFVRAIAKIGWWSPRVQLELLEPGEGLETREDCENQTIGETGD